MINTFIRKLDKNTAYWQAKKISKWRRNELLCNHIHIHGDKDRVLAIKNITPDYRIEGGTHLMVYSRADEISQILNNEINN